MLKKRAKDGGGPILPNNAHVSHHCLSWR